MSLVDAPASWLSGKSRPEALAPLVESFQRRIDQHDDSRLIIFSRDNSKDHVESIVAHADFLGLRYSGIRIVTDSLGIHVRRSEWLAWREQFVQFSNLAERCIDEAAVYMGERDFGGVKLLNMQASRHGLARALAKLSVVKGATSFVTAEDAEVGIEARRVITSSVSEIIEVSAQALGGRGFLAGTISGTAYEACGAIQALFGVTTQSELLK